MDADRKKEREETGCRIVSCGTGEGKCFKERNVPRYCRRSRSQYLWLAEGRGLQGSSNWSPTLKRCSPSNTPQMQKEEVVGI